MRRIVFTLIALGACGTPPPFTLKFDLTQSDGNTCTSATNTIATSCSDVTTSCDSTVSIRVLDPNDPTAPYISVCKQLTGKPDLCAIAGVDLPQPAQPVDEQVLEVQMAVYPTAKLCKDANNEPICPSALQFTSTGFPESQAAECTDPDPCNCPPSPAVGGRTYYHPGDSETIVDLGCADLSALDDCKNQQITVTASVDDFDTEVSVSQSIGDELSVSVGEPTALGAEYVLNPSDAHPLARTGVQPPVWGAEVELTPIDSICIEVLEDSGETTTAVTCQCVGPDCSYSGGGTINLTGVRLAKSTLTDVLGALKMPQFPDTGLVIGIVLDDLGNPASGYTISTSDPSASIEYLSPDRKDLIAGNKTSSSGIFLSVDAPYKTTFTTNGSQPAVGYGGLIDFKASIVVLQFTQSPIGR